MSDVTLSLKAIADELQKGYKDPTQVELDFEVAQSIEERLRSEGWVSPEGVRALVASAGGRIEVEEQTLIDPPAELRWTRNPVTGVHVVEVA
jgi:hypothetical protein